MIHNPPQHSTNSYFFFPFVNLFPQGVKDFSVPIGLDAKVKVDLVVVGSVAVSEKGNSSLVFLFHHFNILIQLNMGGLKILHICQLIDDQLV